MTRAYPAPIRLGVIGVGKMGQFHADAIVALSGARLVAITDDDPGSLARGARRYGVPAYSSLARFFEIPMDAVVITSSTPAHASQIASCADAGLAIFVEKPSGLTMEESDAALGRVVRSGVPFQVGFQRRWDSRYREMKRIIDSGGIGAPVLFTARGRDPGASSPAKWGLDRNGGLFLNCAIHDFDAARYLLGEEPTHVAASAAAVAHRDLDRVGDFDLCNSTVFFHSQMALTEWSRFAAYGYDIQAEVVGTEGVVRLTSGNTMTLEQRGSRPETTQSFFGSAFRAALEGFVTAVQEGSVPTPGVDDARAALQLALLARFSATSGGGRVAVPSLPAI